MPFRSDTAEAVHPLPALRPEAVHVWSASIQHSEAGFERLESVLRTEERQRAARFRFAPDQRRCVVARATLRLLLADYLGLTPSEVPISLTRYGKPVLAGSELQFNVSHSGDWVLLAFSSGREIGIDIEGVRTGLDLEGLATACFSDQECRYVFEDPEAARSRFFQQWACKESWMKADGRGLSLPITEYSLLPRPGVASAFRVVDRSGNELHWTTRRLPCPDGYRAAITGAGEDWSCSIFSAEERFHALQLNSGAPSGVPPA